MERERVRMRPKEHDTWSKGWKALDDGDLIGKYYCLSIPET